MLRDLRRFQTESSSVSQSLTGPAWNGPPVNLDEFLSLHNSVRHTRVFACLSITISFWRARLIPDYVTIVGAQEIFLEGEGDVLLLGGDLTACRFPTFFFSSC